MIDLKYDIITCVKTKQRIAYHFCYRMTEQKIMALPLKLERIKIWYGTSVMTE
jgi:hypothetical protein